MPCKTSPRGPFGTTWGARVRNFTPGFFEEFCVFGRDIQYFVFFRQRGDFQHLLISNASGHCCEKLSLELLFAPVGVT